MAEAAAPPTPVLQHESWAMFSPARSSLRPPPLAPPPLALAPSAPAAPGLAPPTMAGAPPPPPPPPPPALQQTPGGATLKPLHWRKLSAPSEGWAGSVWDLIATWHREDEPPRGTDERDGATWPAEVPRGGAVAGEEMAARLETLFLQRKAKVLPAPRGGGGARRARGAEALSAKRAQNIAICLAGISLPYDELAREVAGSHLPNMAGGSSTPSSYDRWPSSTRAASYAGKIPKGCVTSASHPMR